MGEGLAAVTADANSLLRDGVRRNLELLGDVGGQRDVGELDQSYVRLDAHREQVLEQSAKIGSNGWRRGDGPWKRSAAATAQHEPFAFEAFERPAQGDARSSERLRQIVLPGIGLSGGYNPSMICCRRTT